jgi:class 3 adenylate cyclase/pimeloyl-ACP methyl ester carboxylesterase
VGKLSVVQPETRYAKSGDVHIAYQILGAGPVDLVVVPGMISHVEFFHELPGYSHFLQQLGAFARVITFDKRGNGLSDRITRAATLEERMDDTRAVLDAAGSRQAVLFGISEGGPLSLVFAATYPERTRALVLCGSSARTIRTDDYIIGLDPQQWELGCDFMVEHWGQGWSLPSFAASRAGDEAARLLWAKAERLSASPGSLRAQQDFLRELDVRAILPSVRVPCLVLHGRQELFPIEMGRYLSEHIPQARLVELDVDHYPFFGDCTQLVAEVEEFVTGQRTERETERVLATVLFTDIVDSTTRAAALGDRRWRELLDTHDVAVRREITRARGREIKTTGDGFLAAFDGPARAIRCGLAIAAEARRIGLDVRAGLHTGECEVRGDDLAGIAVHIGARVAARAEPGEVLVSSTVKDLVAGSGLRFVDRGTHDLHGAPGEWRLFAVEG